jgi:hypothetical protein
MATIEDIRERLTEVRPVGLRAILYERVTVSVELADGRTVALDCVPLSGRVMPAK